MTVLDVPPATSAVRLPLVLDPFPAHHFSRPCTAPAQSRRRAFRRRRKGPWLVRRPHNAEGSRCMPVRFPQMYVAATPATDRGLDFPTRRSVWGDATAVCARPTAPVDPPIQRLVPTLLSEPSGCSRAWAPDLRPRLRFYFRTRVVGDREDEEDRTSRNRRLRTSKLRPIDAPRAASRSRTWWVWTGGLER